MGKKFLRFFIIKIKIKVIKIKISLEKNMPNEIHFTLRLRSPEQNLQGLLVIPGESMDWRRDLKKIIAVGKDGYDYCYSQKYPNLRYKNIRECLAHYFHIAERLKKTTKDLSYLPKSGKFTKLGFLSFVKERKKNILKNSSLLDKKFEEQKDKIMKIFCKDFIEEYPVRSPHGQIHFKDYQDCVKVYTEVFQNFTPEEKETFLWYFRGLDPNYSNASLVIFFQLFTILNYSLLGFGLVALLYQLYRGLNFQKNKNL